MKIEIPLKVKEITETFENKGFEIYIVGGAVRDILMGKSVYDWDFTTNAKPEEMLKVFEEAYYTNEFGTVGIPNETEGERPYEITTFRTEHHYSDSRRPDKVEWGETLEEDLKRRDFTINAMALRPVSLAQGKPSKTKEIAVTSDNSVSSVSQKIIQINVELIDLYNGQKDLKDKLIRAVGDSNERFSEDALRMMRAIRIATELKFKIEKDTLDAIKNNASSINKISKERVRDELFKILKSPYPYEGIILLKISGLIQEILPELEKTFGVEQKSPGRHHIYDVGTHSLNSLKYVSEKSSDPIVRLATLIHDIGKPQTYKVLENGTITFYNHEIVSAQIAKRIAERLRFSNKDKEKLYKLVRFHQFSVDERQTDSALRRFIRKVGTENVPDMLDLRVGDRLGGGARETSWRLEEFKKRLIEVQKQPFTVHDLKITGHDVMNTLSLKPGPKVGEILDKLFNEVVDKKIDNEKKALLERLKDLKNAGADNK
jgi:tRNA nucleotidyltransferase (CCA-adding enzyme)